MIAFLDCISQMIAICDRLIATKPAQKLNINIKPHVLKDAIAVCKKAIPNRPTHAVLANFLLKAERGKITLSATNLDTFIELELDGDIIQNGSICIPAFPIQKVVDAITKDVPKNKSLYYVNLSESNQEIEDQPVIDIAYKSFRQAINCMSADEFPTAPEVVGEIHQIPGFIDSFNKLKSHCSKEITQQTLQGVNIGNQKMLATDGHTVAIKQIDSNLEAIIPALAPLQIFDNPSFIVGDNSRYGYIKFFEDGKTVTQRMLEGRNFATWNEIVIPATTVAMINKNELLDALELLRLCALTDYDKKPDILPIWLELKDGKVTVKSYTNLLENTHDLQLAESCADKLLYVSSQQLISLVKTATDTIEIVIDNSHGLIGTRQDDLLLGIMPLARMGGEKVSAKGCGYAPAWEFPYKLSEGCLTVTRTQYGFICAEDLPVIKPEIQIQATTNKYKPQSYQEWCEENPEEYAAHQAWWQEERKGLQIKVQSYLETEPTDLLQAAYDYCGITTENLLKKHYKTLKTFREKFGSSDRNWMAAKDSYLSHTEDWGDLVKTILDARKV